MVAATTAVTTAVTTVAGAVASSGVVERVGTALVVPAGL